MSWLARDEEVTGMKINTLKNNTVYWLIKRVGCAVLNQTWKK